MIHFTGSKRIVIAGLMLAAAGAFASLPAQQPEWSFTISSTGALQGTKALS